MKYGSSNLIKILDEPLQLEYPYKTFFEDPDWIQKASFRLREDYLNLKQDTMLYVADPESYDKNTKQKLSLLVGDEVFAMTTEPNRLGVIHYIPQTLLGNILC